MGSVEVSHLGWSVPGGQLLLDDVSFRVGDGEHAALVGANGAGKTTLLRIIAGEEVAASGTVTVQGSLGVMSQLVGSMADTTVRELYVSLSNPAIREAATRLARTEAQMAAGESDGMAYAKALDAWERVGGYDEEVLWEACAHRVVELPWSQLADRPLATFSGGEQKLSLIHI